ncbi:unnamed protein product, partial [Rotaria sp. Silwood2]
VNANYFCSFYDATKLTWNEFGCTKPRYNLEFDRYECSCNHTTTFALIWSTTIPGTLDTTSASVPGSSDSTSTTVPGTSDTSTITSDATTTTSGTTTTTSETTSTTSETTTTTSDVITTKGATSSVSTTSVILTSTRRPVCLNSSYVAFSNGTCVLNSVAEEAAYNAVANGTNDTQVIVDSLSLYFEAIANLNSSSNTGFTLLPNLIDDLINTTSNSTLIRSNNASFVMFQQLSGLSNVSTVGGAFIRGAGGTLVNASDSGDVTRSKVSAAATISGEFLTGVTSLNMLIIDKPTTYEKIDASTNKSLASSVIVLAVKRNTNVSTPLNISLFLQVLTEYQPSVNANYFCSFYDATKLTWNEFGCTKPRYNLEFDRYECSCNHTT